MKLIWLRNVLDVSHYTKDHLLLRILKILFISWVRAGNENISQTFIHGNGKLNLTSKHNFQQMLRTVIVHLIKYSTKAQNYWYWFLNRTSYELSSSVKKLELIFSYVSKLLHSPYNFDTVPYVLIIFNNLDNCFTISSETFLTNIDTVCKPIIYYHVSSVSLHSSAGT